MQAVLQVALTTGGDTVLNTANGALSVSAGAAISSGSHALTITANDVVLGSGSSMSTDSSGSILVQPSSLRPVVLGSWAATGSAWLGLSATEYHGFDTPSLTIGGSTTTSIRVSGITPAPAPVVSGLVTLLAGSAGAQITFDSAGSSEFGALDAVAAGNIVVDSEVKASVGSLRFSSQSNVAVAANLALEVHRQSYPVGHGMPHLLCA